MRAALYVIAPVLALLAAAAVWAAVLPACGAAPWLGRIAPGACPPPLTPAALAAEAERARGAALRAEAARLQRAVAEMAACETATPMRPGAAFDHARWAAQDLAPLEGCWALDGGPTRVDPATGLAASTTAWRLCLDAAGVGARALRLSDGAACEGPARASFGEDGLLALADEGPAACDAGPPLAPWSGRCALDADGRAVCAMSDGALSMLATLRRAE